MLNKILNSLIDQPVFTSLYVADFAILLVHRPPFVFSLLMVGALVGMSMYLGQKLELFSK